VFKPESSLTHVPATREQVVAIVESINQPQVSIPGKTPQMVAGYLIGLRTGQATFSIFAGLHLGRSGENVIYLPDRRQITTAEDYRVVELEGLQFLESMGFMLDNLNFRNLAPSAQDEALKRIPVFWPARPPSAATPAPGAPSAATGAADPARLARLLASF
jgi:hypothetical protein